MRFWKRLGRYLSLGLAGLLLASGLSNCSSNLATSEPAPSSSAESTPIASAPHGNHHTTKKINLNTAILSELDKLEAVLGIPSLSHQIQSSRPYVSVDDLVAKNVLKPEQLARVRDLVTTEEVILTGRAKDVDYLTKLSLMQGHLLVARELLDRQLPKQAEPHIGHPIEEIYVDISDQLLERQVPDFKNTLLRLQDLVKNKPNDPALKLELTSAMAAIERAIAALPATDRQSPSFVLETIDGLLDTAAAEYTAAISNGKISAAIEYQDSRGFVQYAKTKLLPSIAPTLAAKNPALSKLLTTQLDTLYRAWPDPVPPAKPVLTAEALTAQVSTIQAATAPVVRASN